MLLDSVSGIVTRAPTGRRPAIGKVERFWRTLDDDVIEGATFDNLGHFANELFEYLIYYNNYRPHQALGRTNPKGLRGGKNLNRYPISELVNIDSNDGFGASAYVQHTSACNEVSSLPLTV